MTDLPPAAYVPELHSNEPRNGKNPARLVIVLIAIGVALVLVAGLAFFAITSIQHSMSQAPESSISLSEVAAAKNVVVLRASDAQGKALSSTDMRAAEGVISHRLDRAGIAYAKVAYSAEKVYVIFDDETDPDEVTAAASVVSSDYQLGFRRVIEVSDTCSASAATQDAIADGGIFACERDGIAGYLLGPVELEGTRVSEVETSELSDGQWAVNLLFDAEGASSFATITGELSAAQGAGNQFAMVLDDEVLSAPRVLAAITDGNPQITGNFDQKGAESLANELRLASHGVSFSVENTRTR